ncbi:hypothetical protein D0C36_23755 [Mucilaginibacter conchicola]|uniref:Uncharacterized protein n=1 Tax=Mucilaginibacter conchicola TaxID=2303333 RepID=A0A372NM00_9SPHI|nr:hypothetical protein [Mucilaginibacter conchicola]RFZ89976.1 hypothetical protein D0C36_23755 [Mucilaginibacter conchicola]
MKGQIPYKPLSQPLKLLFNATINERGSDSIDSASRLTYVDIVPSKTSFWSGTQGVQVIREAAPVNASSDNNADAFIQHAAQALYNLHFQIDYSGMPSSLERQEKLWQNWMQLRLLLADTYSGDWVDKTLTVIDHKMLPSDKLLDTTMQDIFFNNYFRNIYTPKFSDGTTQVNRNVFGLMPGAMPVYETWQVGETAKTFEVKFTGNWRGGNLTEIQTRWLKHKSNLTMAEAQLRGSGYFTVNKDTGWCSAFESTYTLLAGGEFEKTITTTLKSA